MAQKITFRVQIKKFAEMGEKTGWTYFAIPPDLAELLNPGVRTAYFKFRSILLPIPMEADPGIPVMLTLGVS